MSRYIPFDPAVLNDDGRIYLYYGWSLPMLVGTGKIGNLINEKIQQNMFHKSLEEIRGESQGIMGANVVELEEDMITVKKSQAELYRELIKVKGLILKGMHFLRQVQSVK